MAKKQRITKGQKRFAEEMMHSANWTYKDFQRHCIVRGMGFEEMLKADIHTLRRFVHVNRSAEIKPELLDEFDNWKETYLKKQGLTDDYFHPNLRLGFIGETDEDGNVTKTRRIHGIKKKKKKREKTAMGIFTGTKKALTYKCVEEGYSIDDTIKEVKTAFPEAKDKSISIWYKKAKKAFPNVKPRVKENEKRPTKTGDEGGNKPKVKKAGKTGKTVKKVRKVASKIIKAKKTTISKKVKPKKGKKL